MSAAATAEYGPDNPRDWDANHPSLRDPRAPHETSGVLRMHRAGKSGADIMIALKLKGTALMRMMQRAMDDETAAERDGRQIHDAGVGKGAR